jgi:hypothetical protein
MISIVAQLSRKSTTVWTIEAGTGARPQTAMIN